MSYNRFLLQVDPEKLAALRLETKQKLAEIEISKTRIAELREIVKRLNDDNDQAASEHQQATDSLQAELAEIDKKHVDAIMAGEQLPTKLQKRRSEILSEITNLNAVLESRCDANRKASWPVEKQIRDLQSEISNEQVIRNSLADLASPEMRRKRSFAALQINLADAGVKEAKRMCDTLAANVAIDQDNESRGFKVDQEMRIHRVRLEDWEWVLSECQKALKAAFDESDRLRDMAAAE